ncbi:MAG TPA: phosphodiester glycosidase family protein [Anaerolineales bacterium]
MKFRIPAIFLLWSLALLRPAGVALSAAEWAPVGEGIEYQQFTLPGPNQAYVARMDRSREDLIVDSLLAQGSLYAGTEAVSGMARRYDGSVVPWAGSWDTLGRVSVAINGIFYDPETGIPETGMIQSGWYIKRFDDLGGGSGFAWKSDGSAFVGGCAYHESDQQLVQFIDRGRNMKIVGINVEQSHDGVVVYTPQFDPNTHTSDGGVEVSVEMLRPAGISPGSRMAIGYIRGIRDGWGSTPIQFDHVVLSARGEAGKRLLESAGIGERVGLTQQITHFETDCQTYANWDWSNTFASIGGSFNFLKESEILSFDDNLGAVQRHPRTVVCFNDDFIYFVVVDGRQPGYSIGMTTDELGRFCLDTLGAEWGINQDGGGSSTMWVNGRVVNRPSDGQERLVANGLAMVALEPLDRSTVFHPGDPILTIAPAAVRLGPGDHYAVLATVPQDASGVILPHINGLNGVFAKGVFWWRVAFEGTQGWVSQDNIFDGSGWVGSLKSVHDKLLRIWDDG